MLKIMNKKSVKTFTVIFASFLIATGCRIGLGEAVDVIAPSIDVTAPKASAIVQKNLLIKGVASDNLAVETITVTVSAKEMENQVFMWDKTWKIAEGENWVDYEYAAISGDEKRYVWEISTVIPGDIQKKEVTITSVVSDKYGNEGASRKDERLITIDGVAPTASISAPLIYPNYTKAYELYDNSDLKDNAVLTNLSNGNFEVKVNQKENTRLGKFRVMMDEEADSTIASYETEPELENLPHVYYNEIKSASRSFSFVINNSDLADTVKNGKHLLRLVTESYDEAGNLSRTVQGFFTYYNEADKPWTELSLGDSSYIDGNTQKEVYPSCSLQGYAYDDDGLKSISVEVEVFTDGEWVKNTERSKTISLINEQYPTNSAWAVDAIAESKHFRVTTWATDKNDLEGDKLTKYFRISDVNPPSITVSIEPASESQLGLSKAAAGKETADVGKITVKGTVTDDGKVKSLKMVRIANKNKQNFLKYYTSTYEGWTETTDGNLLFDISLDGKDKLVDGSWSDTFQKDLYIFKSTSEEGGLGITNTGVTVDFKTIKDTEKKELELTTTGDNIKSHIFIFRVEDSSGSVAIETYTTQGDIAAPTLSIDSIHVVPKNGTTWSKTDSKAIHKDIASNEALPAYKRDSITNAITDKIYFTGKWADNSYDHWKDINKISKITLYNNKGKIEDVTLKADGTWESELIVPEDITTASVQALITDFGGNTTKAHASYYVNSSKPTLLRITSSNSDGTYKNGEKITVIMEYNKKVTFRDSKTEPVLKLNNKGQAVYTSGNGESKHTYTYTVGATTGETASPGTKLKVASLVTNGNNWYDSDNAKLENPTTLTGVNLDEVRELYTDDANPRISKVSVVTGEGHYRKGKELFFQVDFNKPVTIKKYSDAKLRINISNGNSITYRDVPVFSMPSTTTALFKYAVVDGDNTLDSSKQPAKLQFVSFSSTANNVVDIANNAMTNYTPIDNTKNYIAEQNIYIDTGKPETPEVKGLVDGQLYYSDISTISFDKFESEQAATRYYSFDDGVSWTEYKGTGNVTINQNGTYKVCAKQIDLAGNESDSSESIVVSLDKGNLITAITTTNPDGTYKNGDKLVIKLSFRKNISASKVSLNLNIVDKDGKSLSRTAKLAETQSEEKCLYFEYTIQNTDYASKFNVTGITYEDAGFIKDEFNTVVASKTVSGNVVYSDITPLNEIRDIKVVNGKPVVTSVTLTKPEGATEKERELRITFNSEITKQSETKKVGDAATSLLYITLKQSEGFEAPALLTQSQWDEYSSTITDFYEKTTNGWDKNTELPDLSTKYVLKYSNNTDNVNLVNALKALYKSDDPKVTPDTVPVPMGSNYVSVDPSDRRVLVISLKDDYTLPVQGANYSIEIPAQIVENNIGERNDAVKDGSNDYVKTNSGVEAPVIRVNKVSETISGTTITQNPTTTYKVDCQTPGVTISLKTQTREPGYIKLINNGDVHHVVMARGGDSTKKIEVAPDFGIKVADLTDAGTIAKKGEKSIGTALNTTDIENTGYKILIEAVASKDAEKSVAAYESAMRTIIFYYENDSNKISNDTYKKNRWIRGGDNTSGGVSTPGFPLTWDSSDYNKTPRTVRAMSPWSTANDNHEWYWISWNINTTAYVHFLAGDVPADAATKGPSKWWWSSCSWTSLKSQTPTYAGECVYFDTGASGRYGGFKYLSGGTDGEKHRESR